MIYFVTMSHNGERNTESGPVSQIKAIKAKCLKELSKKLACSLRMSQVFIEKEGSSRDNV